MASVSKRLATDETLMLLVDAVNNTETVKQAKEEIQAEGTAQVNNVRSTAEEMVKDINQVPKNTADIADINSNLDTLEFSEIAGGKNLLNCDDLVSGDYNYTNKEIRVTVDFNKRLFVKAGTSVAFSFTPTSKVKLIWLIVVDENNTILEENITAVQINTVTNITKDGYLTPIFGGVDSSGDWTNITINDVIECKPQIEFNNVVTEYEPYIPSVKMLAEENAQQSTEAMDLKMLGWTVPGECPIQNYVDSDGVFHQRVGRVDLGSLDWIYISSATRFYAKYIGLKADNTKTANCYCSKYKTVPWNDYAVPQSSLDKVISLENSGYIGIRDNSYTDATTLKNAMKGVYLYYELETPITKTIDGNEAVAQIKNDLGGLSFSVSGTTLSITDGTNTWTLSN